MSSLRALLLAFLMLAALPWGAYAAVYPAPSGEMEAGAEPGPMVVAETRHRCKGPAVPGCPFSADKALGGAETILASVPPRGLRMSAVDRPLPAGHDPQVPLGPPILS